MRLWVSWNAIARMLSDGGSMTSVVFEGFVDGLRHEMAFIICRVSRLIRSFKAAMTTFG